MRGCRQHAFPQQTAVENFRNNYIGGSGQLLAHDKLIGQQGHYINAANVRRPVRGNNFSCTFCDGLDFFTGCPVAAIMADRPVPLPMPMTRAPRKTPVDIAVHC